MSRIFVERSSGQAYNVVNGDTLANIAAANAPGLAPPLTWQEIALYNWGTAHPDEVARILVERIGCANVSLVNPENSALNPALGTNAQIRLPVLWTHAGLAQDHLHTVTIKKRLPATAIRINSLDKWFIPRTEKCRLNYSLEGAQARADRVDFEVYASNYCKASSSSKGAFLAYSFTARDIPIFQRTLHANRATQRLTRDYNKWGGRSTAAEGVLAPRGANRRYVNVACSPYTVLLRYYRQGVVADRRARLKLAAFWPQFGGGGAPVPASLVVRWSVINCTKLKHGQIVVVDNTNTVVFRKALATGDLTQGDHSYAWNGQDHTGAAITAASMPYRVQLQAHTDMDEDNGLALAAMHSEVRLYVHDSVGTNPLNPRLDEPCLGFEVAPFRPHAGAPAVGSTEWYKLQLANAGFHPGPVDGAAGRDDFVLALKEFQRSYPANNAAPFTRLRIDGKKNNEAQAALANLAANARELFGNPANRADYNLINATTQLNDRTATVIVWVDDRHCYTYTQAQLPHRRVVMKNYRGPMSLGDDRAGKDDDVIPRPWIPLMAELRLLSRNDPLNHAPVALPAVTANMHKAIGPIRIDWTFDEPPLNDVLAGIWAGVNAGQRQRSRARKWVERVTGPAGPGIPEGQGVTSGAKTYTNCPEKVGAPARSQGTDAGATVNIPGGNELKLSVNGTRVTVALTAGGAVPKATIANDINGAFTAAGVDAQAIVDPENRIVIQTTKQGSGERIEIRSASSATALLRLGLAAVTTRGAAPVVCGGIRPANIGDYYKAPFGTSRKDSLEPWKADPDATHSTICTVVHDDLGQNIAKLFPNVVGRAGIYLRPSTIASDGYRLRAQVSFEPLPKGQSHPNREVLKARYPKLPHAHTATLRLWRKASTRGYVGWVSAPAVGWAATLDSAGAFYNAANVHFVHEQAGAAQQFNVPVPGVLAPVNAVMTAIDFENLVDSKLNVNHSAYQGQAAQLSAGYIWPYLHLASYGVPHRMVDHATFRNWLYGTIEETSWDLYSAELIYRLIYNIERTLGKMRGHTVVEFTSSPSIRIHEYKCSRRAPHPNNCAIVRSQIVNNAGAGVGGALLTYTDWSAVAVRPCPRGGCGGTMQRTQVSNIANGIPLCAIGRALGGCWVFQPRSDETWAHEMGHHRHFEHAQANDGNVNRAPGAKLAQHDSEQNPHFAGGALGAAQAHQQCWDRHCIMGYDHANPNGNFCGKCILKNRGWPVEMLLNPSTSVQDP